MPSHEFEMNGERYTLSGEQVEAALTGKEPEVIQDLAVGVNGRWWPVKQAFGAALGKPHSEFNSRRAFDLLRRLGFQMHDAKQDGERPAAPGGTLQAADSAQRTKALELAVALHAGRGQPTAEVIGVAEQFLGWMTGSH
jgi:hypothetical protein